MGRARHGIGSTQEGHEPKRRCSLSSDERPGFDSAMFECHNNRGPCGAALYTHVCLRISGNDALPLRTVPPAFAHPRPSQRAMRGAGWCGYQVCNCSIPVLSRFRVSSLFCVLLTLHSAHASVSLQSRAGKGGPWAAPAAVGRVECDQATSLIVANYQNDIVRTQLMCLLLCFKRTVSHKATQKSPTSISPMQHCMSHLPLFTTPLPHPTTTPSLAHPTSAPPPPPTSPPLLITPPPSASLPRIPSPSS